MIDSDRNSIDITVDPHAALAFLFKEETGGRSPTIVLVKDGTPVPPGTRWNRLTDLSIAAVRAARSMPMYITEADASKALKASPKMGNIGVISGRKDKAFRSPRKKPEVYEMTLGQLNAIQAEVGKLAFATIHGSQKAVVTSIRVKPDAGVFDPDGFPSYAVAVNARAKDSQEMLRIYESWFRDSTAGVWPAGVRYLNMLRSHLPFAVVHSGATETTSLTPLEWPESMVDQKPHGLVLFTPDQLPRAGSRITVPSLSAASRLLEVLKLIHRSATIVRVLQYAPNMQVKDLSGLYEIGAYSSGSQGARDEHVVEQLPRETTQIAQATGLSLNINLTNESRVIWLSDATQIPELDDEENLLAFIKVQIVWCSSGDLAFLKRAYRSVNAKLGPAQRALTIQPIDLGSPSAPLVREEFWEFLRTIGSPGGSRVLSICAPPESGKSALIRTVCTALGVPVGTGFHELESVWYEKAHLIEAMCRKAALDDETDPSEVIEREFEEGNSMFSLANARATELFEKVRFLENDGESCRLVIVMSHLAEFIVGRTSMRASVLAPEFLTDQTERVNPLGIQTRKLLYSAYHRSALSVGTTVQYALSMAEYSLALQLARVTLSDIP